MAGRTIAIGDIHGYTAALDALLEAVRPAPDDTIVTLGDYIDRGPDSRGTIGRLIRLADECRLVPLLGNHDEMLLSIIDGRIDVFPDWLSYGGNTTLHSYDCTGVEGVPEPHVDFLRNCRDYHETATHFFLHANYHEDLPLAELPVYLLRWETLRSRTPGPHYSGKTAIVSHTAQRGREVLDLGHLVCIDTYLYGGGWLTALDVEIRRLWQVDAAGRLRDESRGE